MVGKKNRSGRKGEVNEAVIPRNAPVKSRHKAKFQFKLDVINHFAQHKDMDATMAKYFSTRVKGSKSYESARKGIYKWMKQRNKIEAKCTTIAGGNSTKSRPEKLTLALGDENEKFLVEWINELRRDGCPVSSLMITLKAKLIAAESGINNFAASHSWKKGFMKRHRFSFRVSTRVGQISPEDAEAKKAEFALEVRAKMQELGVNVIYAADQTAQFWEVIPKSTVNETGAKTVWVRAGGNSKERMTVMLLGDSNGVKYNPWIVLKSANSKVAETESQNRQLRNGFGKQVWTEVSELQQRLSVTVHRNVKGWWNQELMMKWISVNFGFSQTPKLLLVDDFSGHWTPQVMSFCRMHNVHAMKVPAKYTSVCSPCDVSWNGPFKRLLRNFWVSDLMRQINEAAAGPAPRPQFKMEAPGRKTNVEWCRFAWDTVTNRTIRSGFVKCGFVDADDEKAEAVENVFAASEQENELAELLVRMNLNDPQCGEIGNEDDIMRAGLDDDEVDIIESDEESEEEAADHLSDEEETEDDDMVAGPVMVDSDDTQNDDCVMDEYEYLD